MNKVNLNVQLLDLAEKEIKENKDTLGVIFANAMVKGDDPEAIKVYDMALKLYSNEVLELDDSDFEKLKKLLKESNLTVLVRAQIGKIFLKVENK